jgi:hypothetical protein
MVLYFSGIEENIGKRAADALRVAIIAAILILPFLAYSATLDGTDDRVKTALVVVAAGLALVQAYAMFLEWRKVKDMESGTHQ